VLVEALISDDNPFNNNDTIVQTSTVKIKITAIDPPSPAPATASGVTQFCIVSYVFDFVERIWVPEECEFAPLPAPEAGNPNTFIIDTTLQAQEGVAYAFVWVSDAAGNVSRVPGFDVVSFVPNTPISLNRNDVLILRLPLAAGQNLELTADLVANGGFGDVDISVFDDFANPNATRIALSANNGNQEETVTLNGPCRCQVEIRALVNSRFTLAVDETAQVAVDQPTAPVQGGEGISIAGPPALNSAIDAPVVEEEDGSNLFIPSVEGPED
jgi:hypothetical protein